MKSVFFILFLLSCFITTDFTTTLAMKIAIGCDHGAFELKEMLVPYLRAAGHEVVDVGIYEVKRVDYPDIAVAITEKVISGECERGIALCGTGIGISIACNKVNGIRCALCHDHFTAKLCRQHNNANVLAMGGRTTGPEVAKEIVDTFLTTDFEGDRHAIRLEKMVAIEASNKK